MNLEELRGYKPAIQSLAREYKVDPDSIRVFGSVARGDAKEGSDVDLCIHLLPDASIFDIAGFNESLRRLLSLPVDTIPDESITQKMRLFIQGDLTSL